jgi:hypothetical protein
MENLKEALKTVIETGEATVESLEDGKISIGEGVSITWKAIGFIKVVQNFPVIKEEFTSLTEEQKEDLVLWFNEEFDIVNEDAEAVVELIFTIIINLGSVFTSVSKK